MNASARTRVRDDWLPGPWGGFLYAKFDGPTMLM